MTSLKAAGTAVSLGGSLDERPDAAGHRKAIVADLRHDLKNARLAAVCSLDELAECLQEGSGRVALASLEAALGEILGYTAQCLELLTLDARFALGLGRSAPGPEVVVAWIDQESMDYMDRNDVPFPWPREVYGQVLDHLRTAGAKAVVFDVLFDQRGNAEDDRTFATALAQGPGDALAMKFVGYRQGGRDAAETEALAARGYRVEPHPWEIGDVQLLLREGAVWLAAADPRGRGEVRLLP
jgi:hypothetical protein